MLFVSQFTIQHSNFFLFVFELLYNNIGNDIIFKGNITMSFIMKDATLRKIACNSWGWSLATGILISLCGLLGLLYAGSSTLASILFFGVLEIIVGITQIIHAYGVKTVQQVLFHFILGLTCIAAGIVMIIFPEAAALSLTLLIAMMLIVSGIARVIASLSMYFEHWVWLLINGFLGIILGMLILYQWPVSGFWVIGTLVSLDILFTGSVYVALAMRTKQLCALNHDDADQQ